MVSESDAKRYLQELKHKAIELIDLPDDINSSKDAESIEMLVSELRTHQIELELQNQELQLAQTNLSLSLKKYSDLFNFAPCGYMTIDLQGKIQEVNKTCAHMFLLPADKIKAKSLTEFIVKEDQDIYYHFQRSLLKNCGAQVCSLRLLLPTNQYLHVQLATIVTTTDELDTTFRMSLTNISEQVKSKSTINVLTKAMQLSPLSILITDHNLLIEYSNQTYQKSIGKKPEQLLGVKLDNIRPFDESLNLCLQHIPKLTNDHVWQGEYCNNNRCWQHISISTVMDEKHNITNYLIIKKDITLRKAQEKELAYQANFDSLTKLPNRACSLQTLERLISESKRTNKLVAVLFLDLDNFKKINDSLGHAFGDKFLIVAANQLSASLRESDFIARFGGDEFTIFLTNITERDDVLPILEHLVKQLNKGFIIDGRELMVTVSIGVAIYPFDNATPATLLRDADTAMYHAKSKGKNTYSFFESNMNKHAARRLLIEEQMIGALERQEFTVFYQAQIDIKSGRLVGIEALLRWQHAIIGEVLPEEFIPIAEQAGFIIPLGQFVLAEAIAFTAKYQNQYQRDLRISVNLSPRQFRDKDLVEFIDALLASSGIRPASLELEITEGLLMYDCEHALKVLNRLKAKGIRISMDDFGTGYSSLSYIRKYPFDVLKVDRTFVSDLDSTKSDQSLVKASIAMAHALNIKVIAEGVENKAQLSLLRDMDCDIAQGFIVNKPLNEEDFCRWATAYEHSYTVK